MKAAIQQASRETARFMSARLRSEASRAGWPAHAAGSLAVSYSKTGFNVHMSDEASAIEYGIGSQPDGTVHRFKNDTQEAEQFFLQRLEQYLEKYDLPTI